MTTAPLADARLARIKRHFPRAERVATNLYRLTGDELDERALEVERLKGWPFGLPPVPDWLVNVPALSLVAEADE